MRGEGVSYIFNGQENALALIRPVLCKKSQVLFAIFGTVLSISCVVVLGGESCTSHNECLSDSQFCAWTQCTDPTGWTYRCGACAPCGDCLCPSSAIDGACPADRCPDAPTQGVRYLAGDFWAVDQRPQLAALGYACARRLSFAGAAFTDTQAPISIADPATKPPTDDAVALAAKEAACPSLDRSGVFSLAAGAEPARLQLTVLAARSGPHAPPPDVGRQILIRP